jgi:hypothetical protein
VISAEAKDQDEDYQQEDDHGVYDAPTQERTATQNVMSLQMIVKFPINLAPLSGFQGVDLATAVEAASVIIFVRDCRRWPQDAEGMRLRYRCETCRYHKHDWWTSEVPLNEEETRALSKSRIQELPSRVLVGSAVEDALYCEMTAHVNTHAIYGEMMVRERQMRGIR